MRGRQAGPQARVRPISLAFGCGRSLSLNRGVSLLNSQFCPRRSCTMTRRRTDPSIIGTSSIDTTCTIWDVEVGKAVGTTKTNGEVKTQLIAHDQEVRQLLGG